MSLIDRLRELFSGRRSGAEYGAATGGAVAATSADDRPGDADTPSAPAWSGGGDSGGGGGGDGGGAGTV